MKNSRPSLSPDEAYFDRGRLQALQLMLCARSEELLNTLATGLRKVGRWYSGACPVHGGDNSTALTFYPEGESAPGYWRCQTRHCERDFKSTIIGLVRGVLSHRQCGWMALSGSARAAQRKLEWKKTVDFCCDFLGVPLGSVEVDHGALERARFASSVAIFNRKPSGGHGQGLTRQQVRSRLVLPSPYFLSRGYSASVLDRHDVGDCDRPGRRFSQRAVVPVYDEAGQLAVAHTARSVHPRCPTCKLWHSPPSGCPRDAQEEGLAAKWVNSLNSNMSAHLYNWHMAKKPIAQTAVAALVEGAGEVWRLVEAGVEVGVGLLGSSLSDEQQVRLECSGAMTLICLLNQDEAGAYGHEELRRRLSGSFRLVFPQLPTDDLGAMTPQAVRDLVGPIVQKHTRKH